MTECSPSCDEPTIKKVHAAKTRVGTNRAWLCFAHVGTHILLMVPSGLPPDQPHPSSWQLPFERLILSFLPPQPGWHAVRFR